MEQTRKRKEKDGDDRGGGGGGGGERRRKTAPQTIKAVDDKEKEAVATEEEVEEFYAIVRRMQAAVKYFEKGSDKNINSGGDQVRWRAALEATLPAVVDADDHVKSETSDDDHGQELADNNIVLDLNEVPVEEAETTT